MAAERLGVWQFDWSNRLLAFFCIGAVLVNIALFNILKFSISRRHLDTDKKDNEDRGHSLKRIGKSYLTTELIFTEVDDKDIVAILCPETSGDLFVHSPNVQDIWSIWQVLRNLKKGKRSRWVKILLLPIILAYWVGQAIPLIYYTNVVLVVILSLVHRRFSKKKDGRRVLQVGSAPGIEEQERGSLNQVVGEESKQTVADVLLLYLALLPFCFVFVFVTAPVFFQMFIACSYLIDVVGYTLVGVIVNAKYVVAWIVFVLGVVSFLVQTITGYSNTYVTLFYEIFNIAKSVGSKAVSRDAEGVPQIKLDFFFRFAYRIKPWKPVLFFIYLHLASAGVFFFLGYLLLRYVGGLNDLKGQSELLGAVVIGGLLPIAKLLAVSPATANCKGKAKKCKLEQMIKDYEAAEQGEIQVPEAEAEEFHSFGNQRNGNEGQIQQVSVGDHV